MNGNATPSRPDDSLRRRCDPASVPISAAPMPIVTAAEIADARAR